MRTLILLTALAVTACGGREAAPERDDAAISPAPPDSMPADIVQDAEPAPIAPPPVLTDGGGAPANPGPSADGDAPSPAPAEEPAAEPQAQADEGAAALRRASAAYTNVRSLKADFVMHYTNPLTKQNMTSRGTLYQRRPDRIALRFSEPAGDVILGDGTWFYQYYPSVNPQQATRVRAGAADQSKVDLQAQFIGNPVERFDYTLHGVENVGGRPAHVMTLVPKVGAEYRSLKVWIDTRDGLARRFELVERNGIVRRFDFTGMQTNTDIADSVFRFSAPEGVRVITAG